MSLCSSNPTSDYLDPVTESQAEAAVHKVRNKDLVLPLGMDRDFFAWMAADFSDSFIIIILVVFTMKRVLQLFLGLLPILRDSYERQANPDSPNS